MKIFLAVAQRDEDQPDFRNIYVGGDTLQDAVDRVENIFKLHPAEAKVLLMTRSIYTPHHHVRIIEQEIAI